MDKSLDLLKLRLDEIEQQLYGYPQQSSNPNSLIDTNTNTTNLNNNEKQTENSLIQTGAAAAAHLAHPKINIAQTLAEIDNNLKALTVGRDRFNKVFNDLQKYQKWLQEDDRLTTLSSTLGSNSSVVKFEEILAFQDEIRLDSERIQEIERLTPGLDKPYLGEIAEHKQKLSKFKLNIIEMKEKSKSNDTEMEKFIEMYTKWYQNLIERIKKLDQDILELEREKEKQRYDI